MVVPECDSAGRRAENRVRAPIQRHQHLGADAHPIEQVDDVLVEHADAAICREVPDRVRAVRAVDGVLLAAGQRQRARSHRIARRAAGDDVGQARIVAADLVRRRPGRVDMLALDRGAALPLPAGPPDPDRIADRLAVAHDEVELALVRAHDDGARPLRTLVGHERAGELRPAARKLDRRNLLRLARQDREGVREVGLGRELRRLGRLAGRERRAGEGDEESAS
jgi:hypothetical protein